MYYNNNMSGTLPTGGETSLALIRDNLYNFDKECFVDKLATASQNGCSAAYSTRLLRSNYYGPMVRVRRSTDNVEQDFYGDVFGKLGTRVYAGGTSLTSWLGGATGFVTTLYDQSGNVRNVTQTTNANQPIITSNVFFDDFNTDTSSNYLVNTFFVNSGTSSFVWDTANSRLTGNTSNNEMGIRVNPNLLPSNIDSIDITVSYLGTSDNDGVGIMIYDSSVNRVWMATLTADYPSSGNVGETTWESGLTQRGNGIAYVDGLSIRTHRYVAVGDVQDVNAPHTLRLTYNNNSRLLAFYVDGTLHTSYTTPTPIKIETFGVVSLACNPPVSFGSIRAEINGGTNIKFNGSQWLQVTNTQIPTAAMTSNSSGGLIASASSIHSATWDAWKAFDFNSGTGWHNSTSSYVVGTGLYTGAFTTTDVNGVVHRGEWLQIQLASAIKLNSFYITPRAGNATERSPRDFVVLGSNNGTSWNVVHQEFNITNWTTASKTFTVLNANPSYSYYRIVTKRIGNLDSGMAGSDTVQIMEWILNPTTVPLAAGDDTYTYYATWTPTSNNNVLNICEQNTSSIIGNRRAALTVISMKYGFVGEGNDNILVPLALNIRRRTVLMCNHTLATGNVEVYDEGVLYKGTGTPANLNVGGDIFVIGRCATKEGEYFIGDINEIIVTNNTALEREALIYFTPTLLTKPRELFPKPKKMLTFAPITDNPTPLNHGPVADLNLDLINVGNGNAVSDWNGYAQGTSGNRPVYYDRGGFTNDMGYVNFTRSSGQFLDGGSRTFNIATNGGFSMVCLVQFSSPANWDRIVDFGNGAGNASIIVHGSGANGLTFYLFEGTTGYGITAASAYTANEWCLFTCRYRTSDNYAEIRKNGVLLISGTFAAMSNRTLSNCYIGKSNYSGEVTLDGKISGLYMFDRYISDIEMVALANGLMTYSLPNIPRHISELSMVDTQRCGYLPARTGWSGYFNGTSGNYIDLMEAPDLPMSYCFWFYQTTNTYSTIVGLTDLSRAGNGIQIDYPTATNRMTIFAALPTAWSSFNIENVLINTWYHIVVTVNTNFQVQVYLNGTYQNQLTGTGILPSRSRFIIGASGDGGRGYGGYIQDFRVYDYILRSDEITKLYDGISLHQNSLQTPANYLVNRRNWYSLMQTGKASGGSFGGAFTITSGGVDPNVQYQLLNSTQNVQNYIYHYQRIQDYRSFTCSFEIYIASGATGDQMYFFVGASSLPVYDNLHNNSNSVGFQVYNQNGNARPGVNFWRLGTNVFQSDYTRYIGASRWVSVSITYNRNGNEATWVINMDGNELITYTDTNNESWRASSGNYWGIGAWDIGAVMTCYVRRVELTYVPQASSILNRNLILNSLKRHPEGALSANSSQNCVASASTTFSSGFHPAYKAFDYSAAASGDTASSTMYHSAWSTYNSTTGAYIGGVSTTVSGVSYSGEWLQIQLPRAIRLFSYTLSCRPGYVSSQSPNTWVIAGSNDGTTWTLLDSETNVSTWDSLRLSFNVNNSATYTYFRIICTVTGQSASSDRQAFVVSEWELYSIPFNGIKYPIGPMTSDTTTFNGGSLGCGTYRTTYSSTWEDNTLLGWRAFTNEANDCYHIANNGTGAGSGGGLYRGTNGAYTGTVSTTISGTNVLGEWLQIELPHPIRLTRYSLLSRNGIPNQSAQAWRIAGSNDNSTWTEVDNETGITGWADNVARTFTTTNFTTAYKYYRMITTNIQDPSGWHWSQREWMLYDDTTTTTNMYGKVSGLIEGLTWKLFDGWISTVNFDHLNYYNIGRCTDTGNINRILNGEFVITSGAYINYGTEIIGYFRANVTGTWSFKLWGNDVGYFWIGSNALSGYTLANANITANLATGTTTIYLVEGVYYPIRIRHSQQTGVNDLQFYFTPPNGTESTDGTGYFFSSIGTNQAYPAESARVIKEISQTNIDGVYYINVNGVSTATYCLMNDIYDGGGWMMLMKATTGTTFNYNANYWTTQNTLNPTDTTRNNSDAKFDTFNYMPIKDVMAIWPDIASTSYTNVYGKNGGSLLIDDGWVWKIDNWSLYAPPLDQLSSSGRSAAKGAYALSRLSMSYTGPTIKIRRSSDNVEQDFYANVAGNMGTLINATGTTYDSWIGNIFNPTNWYTIMTAGGTAGGIAGANPDVQSQVATGGNGTYGYWAYGSLPMSTYNSLYFSSEIYWAATSGYSAGDFYSIDFGSTTAGGAEGIRILFMFWSGYSNNGFSGTGIYILKNNVAIAKSTTSPSGPGNDQWYPISIIYTKSITNTWQVNINGISALTYSDPNALTWAASAGSYFNAGAASGGGLRMSVWYKRLYLASNVAYVTTWYDQSGSGNHGTQTTTTAQPMYIQHYGFIDFYNDSARFLNIPSGTFTTGTLNAPFSVATRHGAIQNTSVGGFYGAGAAAANQANNLRMAGGNSYNHYFFNNDYGYGSYAVGNYLSLKYDGTTRVGYVNNLIPSGTNTVNGATVASGQQYIGKTIVNEYLNGQMYFMYIFNISITDADLIVCNNTTNYLIGSNLASSRQTALAGFQISRDTHPSNPNVFNGFSTSIFSYQSPALRHIIGGGSHLNAGINAKVRWGLVWNENSANDFGSIDAFGGIGMQTSVWWGTVGYSAGDAYGCCGVAGINRSARLELYGR